MLKIALKKSRLVDDFLQVQTAGWQLGLGLSSPSGPSGSHLAASAGASGNQRGLRPSDSLSEPGFDPWSLWIGPKWGPIRPLVL